VLEASIVVIVLLVAAILGYATTRPNVFQVERSTSVNAGADRIFPLINDFHRWAEWSPFEKLDPTMRKTYGGSEEGVGATYEWEGNSKAGKGRMEITDSTPPSLVKIALEFEKPFPSKNVSEFTLEPAGEQTRVIWAMHGPSPFVAKLMGIFVNMDQMIGRDFEAGLATMKGIAES